MCCGSVLLIVMIVCWKWFSVCLVLLSVNNCMIIWSVCCMCCVISFDFLI